MNINPTVRNSTDSVIFETMRVKLIDIKKKVIAFTLSVKALSSLKN